MRKNFWILTLALVLPTFLISPARASFHLWIVNEVYSNADGTVQFIEFTTEFGNQTALANQKITASLAGQPTKTNTLPSNLPAYTASAANPKFFLVATPGFASLPGGVTPDYVMPTNFLYRPNGAARRRCAIHS